MELKILKALFESCFQAILQVAILMRSNKIQNYNFLDLLVIFVSLISVSVTCSKHINYEIYFMNESHLDSNLLMTYGNTLLYFFIVLPRISCWALIWSYYGTVFSAVISIVHLITTFCISYYHTEQVTANREWTAGKFAVSIVDAMASKFSPIFPRTMLKMASSSTLILVAFLGLLYPLLGYNAMNMSNCAMSKENTPIFSCVPTNASNSDANFLDSFEIEFHTSLFDNDAKCEPHMHRLKEDNRTFIGSWRCPDFWQESADTLNNYCERPEESAIFFGCVQDQCRTCKMGEDPHKRLFQYVLPTTICLLLIGPLLTWLIQRYALSDKFSPPRSTATNIIF